MIGKIYPTQREILEKVRQILSDHSTPNSSERIKKALEYLDDFR